jgi:molybdopterin biosynthesis enzyme
MRPFGDVITLEAARAILDATGIPIDRTETIPLEDANSRVVAGDIIARDDVPPFSRAGMDGYAVRAGDTRGASSRNSAHAQESAHPLHRPGIACPRRRGPVHRKSRPALRCPRAPMRW